jgi:hypothetical protein
MKFWVLEFLQTYVYKTKPITYWFQIFVTNAKTIQVSSSQENAADPHSVGSIP